MAYIDEERIAEIKNALTVIHLNAQSMPTDFLIRQKMIQNIIN